MIKTWLKTIYPIVLICMSFASHSANYLTDKPVFVNGYPESAQVSSLQLEFSDLGFNGYRIDGVNKNAYVDFTNRFDKLSKDLTLHFSYSNSPSLIDNVSHLKVYFNDNLVTVLPINKQLSITKNAVTHDINLNAKFIKDFNQIRFELVGYYDLTCQDYFSKTIWTEINKSSHITLNQQSLAIDSHLEYLPQPFFDKNDYSQLNLPFVFATQPSKTTLEAATTLSSWFGSQADWRGAKFPVSIDTSPKQHSVIFATNNAKPSFLADYPDVDKPTIEIISSPLNRYNKLLLILGRDDADLKTAVTGLVFGHQLMTGRTASIDSIKPIALRKAYDAPRWIRSDRAVSFEELIDYPTQLQSTGLNAPPVKLSMRFAPDLFTWREKGIPLNLLYRNTPNNESITSRLNILINKEYINGYLLSSDGTTQSIEDTFIPLITGKDATQTNNAFTLDGIDLAKSNDFEFDFKFGFSQEKGQCSVPAGGEFGAIEGSSTIDISGFDHYIALPDLNVFAHSGFPFTKYADLQQSLFLIEKKASTHAISTLLNTAGHFGAITGHPVNKLTINYLSEDITDTDKDILIITTSTQLADTTTQNVLLKNTARVIDNALYNGQFDNSNTEKVQVNLTSSGDMAIISGYQSPFDSDRSIVSLTASTSDAFYLLNDTLLSSEKLNQIKGSAAIINSQRITTLKADDQYFVGYIPVHTLIWFHLSDHPILLALLSILTLLLISFILWQILKVLTQKRLAEGDE
ncbi:cellulose biosynthesis cyclic di-GMP-binding regulatory protein BcsB [Pseudoalteromonas sp. MMG010]|uniref:cellulose biosynthesis cyclic di-GMP-binding regulatory protein BcsB n=1 Tax=Pseudoalteromonas sp. MMG010 TaxID=2822685 RepID=UPI001B3A0C75|nr:cellulose biosynthesis cyclic di-GMP-binding regulatory protein BcsB [Pseudoalteromonas sp. MMG010]MBQ4833098.1 cellulose biosynthesis cyclic di-GMP-binding regulatory protein BcsB [Pseudoalteromonas sp. MMG010]